MSSTKTRRIARAVSGVILAGLVAACGSAPEPAPVYMGSGADQGLSGPPPEADTLPPQRANSPPPAPITQAPLGPPPLEGRRIVVERGESLSLVARRYHVSESAIIAANHLRPPYQVEAGQHLLIPGGDEAPAQQATLPGMAPPGPGGLPPPPGAGSPAGIMPLDNPAPPSPEAGRPPAIVPLDAPPSPGQGSLRPPPSAPPPPAGEPSVAEEARTEGTPPGTAAGGGRFPWPVRGHIVGTYGPSANGAHNDGINIAAPLGSPVRAIAAGEVAYAGNELRGYGNLVLIKHPDGWISAYAHCEELLVRKGDHVNAGQVIAKVGATGGVGQPQLHFELRRGQSPVDPRQFLAPSPAASG